MNSKLWRIFAASLGLFLPFASSAKSVSVKSASGISAQLENSGHYEIVYRQTHWKFAGEFGKPVMNAMADTGADRIGAYREIHFTSQAGVPVTGSIRVYDSLAMVLFTLTCDEAAEKLPIMFPRFTSFPARLHHFSFENQAFAAPVFRLETNGTPWLLFDDRANAALISPADHFLMASMAGDGAHEIASGLNEDARHLPANFSHSTLIAFAPGIHAVWKTWGDALLSLQGKVRPANDADIGLRYLGYWTDNGADYYYNYDKTLGYAGTLEKLAERYRQEHIPIRYLQLDSWWYYKTFTGTDGKIGRTKNPKLPAGEWNRYGGLLKYEADADLFPNGLAAFQKKIDLPLITHNRWIDPASPYHQNYKISGIAAIDPKWWDDIMAYIASNGVVCYEQDWLSEIYYHSPEFHTTAGVGDAFADNMARAALAKNVSLQYCMALPCFFLQGSRYPNLTTIRVSDDRFCRPRWDHFLYVSQLADAVGVWPWADVFMSGETNNLLISVLSAGMVGTGDAIGKENKKNLLRAARADGVLVKPDEPLLPLDDIYIADANGRKTPMVAWTRSDHGSLRTAYVFAYNRQKSDAEADFTPMEFGLKGNVCVLDTQSGSAHFQSARKRVGIALTPDGTAYYEVTPVGKSGLAFFGDEGKFVSNGRQRIAALDDAPGKLTVTVIFAAGEKSVRLFGYAKKIPTATAQIGSVGTLAFDAKTRRFSVELKPGGTVTNSGKDPIQTAMVVFEAR
ncbi:MAG: hypothetical protein ACREFE_09730 [Limisphaerales bacterium]